MVSTLDFESSDPSSNLGGTSIFRIILDSAIYFSMKTIGKVKKRIFEKNESPVWDSNP